MKLKSFNKVNASTKTEYVVFDGDKAIDIFTVDYLCKNVAELNAAILKRMDYEKQGAAVRFVDTNSANGCLRVTVEI